MLKSLSSTSVVDLIIFHVKEFCENNWNLEVLYENSHKKILLRKEESKVEKITVEQEKSYRKSYFKMKNSDFWSKKKMEEIGKGQIDFKIP